MIVWSALAGQWLALLFTVVVGVVVFDDIVLLTEEHNHSCSETEISLITRCGSDTFH